MAEPFLHYLRMYAALAALGALKRLDGPPDEEAEQVRRLFDDHSGEKLVEWEHDWHPSGNGPWLELDAWDTLGNRRAWYRRLVATGYIEDREAS